jgi:hypothetical protein
VRWSRRADACPGRRAGKCPSPIRWPASRRSGDQGDRRRDARITAKHLEGKAKLRTNRAQAARTLWTLTVPELYVVQTHTAGLTSDQYERWLGDLLVAALLEP